jgi:hypothetical protein
VNDIEDVLEQTARSFEVEPSDETVEADIQRGRTALVQRRRGRTIRWGVAGIATVLVAGAAIVAGNLGDAPHAPSSSPGARTGGHASAVAGTSVRLVAYHGDQLEGFVVDQVPEGWFLQGSNPYALTIAPQGDATSPDDFEGKLVVMLLSSSAPQKLPKEDPVEVDGNAGVISHGPPADTLTYRDDAGHFVQVQAWQSSLGWTDEQLVSFAAGVHVTSDAQAGVG